MQNNVIIFQHMQAIVVNTELLEEIRKQEEAEKKRLAAAMKQLEAERGKRPD